MIYEAEAFKKDSAYCEHNTVVGLTHAIAKKLNIDSSKIHDPSYKDIVHQALKPLYEQFDRVVWRIEYLFRAIQDSSEGKNLTPTGGYLKKDHHQYLTTDGRIQARGVKFKRDFHSLSLVGKDNETIGWANLSFEEIANLHSYLTFCLIRDYQDLASNIESFEKEMAESPEENTKENQDDLASMRETLNAWKKLLDKNELNANKDV